MTLRTLFRVAALTGGAIVRAIRGGAANQKPMCTDRVGNDWKLAREPTAVPQSWERREEFVVYQKREKKTT